jgi:hypothetical protein
MLAVLSITGCGENKAPLAPEASIREQAPSGVTYLTFSPQALERAGKIATIPEAGKTVSKTFYPDQTASMKIQDLGGPGTRDDLEVEFTVRAGDLDQPTTITMTVYGNKISDLVMAFEPHGLVFNTPAQLELKIGAKRVDHSLLDLQALLLPFGEVEGYHDHDGSVTSATITSVKAYIYALLLGEVETSLLGLSPVYDYARIKVDVPGFSRYGLSR